jgi:hypothetical protein
MMFSGVPGVVFQVQFHCSNFVPFITQFLSPTPQITAMAIRQSAEGQRANRRSRAARQRPAQSDAELPEADGPLSLRLDRRPLQRDATRAARRSLRRARVAAQQARLQATRMPATVLVHRVVGCGESLDETNILFVGISRYFSTGRTAVATRHQATFGIRRRHSRKRAR